MTDMSAVLAWKLHAWTGYPVWAFQKPEGASLPCLVYQVISDPIQDSNHSGGGSIHFPRVQITHIGTTDAQAKTLADTVYRNLEGNKTDFLAARSDGTMLERKEAEGIFVVVKGYFIQYRS